MQQRDLLAVDRDVHVLGAEPDAATDVQTKFVFGVSRKRVRDHHAAARAIGGSGDVIPRMLRHILRNLVDRLRCRSLDITNHHARDCSRRVQVRFGKRRRQRLHIGDVVEVCALGIERQKVTGVDFDFEEILDDALVLRAIHALKGAIARVNRSRVIHVAFERFDQREQRVALGSLGPRWRHHLGAQLPDHLFCNHSVFRGIVDAVGGENQVALFRALAVTGATVRLDDVGQGRAGDAARSWSNRSDRQPFGSSGTRHPTYGRHCWEHCTDDGARRRIDRHATGFGSCSQAQGQGCCQSSTREN